MLRFQLQRLIDSKSKDQMMSDYVPEAADTLAVALPQPTSVDDATAMISDDAPVQQKQHEDASPANEKMDEDDKENVVPTSENVVAQSPGGPGTPTKRKHKSGRIGKRELLQVASPKARWLPRVQEKRRGRSINRFEFEGKEVQPLWEGEGRKLEDSELVVDNIKFFSRNDTFLKQVHQIFYNRACKANEVKANLIAFSGLPDYYQGKAQEKLEAKSVSFLKLLADVLGVAHGEDGKKTLVADLVAFLAAPRKVRRGVNLADKAEALKEQRRVAKEKKEKKAKRTSTGGKDKTKNKKKDGTKKKPKAKASDFYSDIESDDDEDDEDMDELYKWDEKTQARNEAEAKQTLDRIAEREAAELQKKLDKKKNKNKRKASEEDDEDEESEDESEDEKAKAKRKKERKREEAEKKRKAEKEKEKEKRRRKKKAEEEEEEEERKKRKIVKAKRKHEERAKAAKASEEEEKQAPKSTKRSRAEVSDDDDEETAVAADAADEAAAKAQAEQEGSSRKRRKIVVASDDDEDDEAAAEVAAAPAADSETNKMQVEEKKVEEEEQEKKVESEEEKERREKTEKTQEAIKETLRRYLKEQLTVEEARLQTPKLLRLHVEAALGHSVEEHSAFILQCVRQLFSTTA